MEQDGKYLVFKPSGMPLETWNIIIDSWENGLSDRETAFRASKTGTVKVTETDLKKLKNGNQSVAELYEYLHEELASIARLNVAEALRNGDRSVSKWFLERKKSEEFSTKAAVAFEGAVVGLSMEEKEKELQKLIDSFGGKAGENADGEGEV